MAHLLEKQPNNPRMVIADALDGARVTNRKQFDVAIDYNDAFHYSNRFTLTDTSTREIVITNPASSGIETHIVSSRVASTGQNLVDINYNSSIDTSGTSISPKPITVGDTHGSDTNIEQGGTYTVNDSDPIQYINPGGATKPSKVGSPGKSDSFDIESGNNIHLIIENDSGSDSTFSYFILFWEKELD